MRLCRLCKKLKPLSAFSPSELTKKTHNRCRECMLEHQRTTGKQSRMTVLNHYGPFCKCCGEDNTRFLTIDHINNDGAKQRKENKVTSTGYKYYTWIIKNNYPEDLQILCYNCNCGRQLNSGICPHQDQAASLVPDLSPAVRLDSGGLDLVGFSHDESARAYSRT